MHPGYMYTSCIHTLESRIIDRYIIHKCNYINKKIGMRWIVPTISLKTSLVQPNIADQVSDEIIFSLSTAFPITCSAFSASFETFDIFFTAFSPSNINSVILISERFSYSFFLGYEFEVRTVPRQRSISILTLMYVLYFLCSCSERSSKNRTPNLSWKQFI